MKTMESPAKERIGSRIASGGALDAEQVSGNGNGRTAPTVG